MAREAPDRLSRGLAREELRNLRRAVGDTHSDGSAILRLLDLMRDRTVPKFEKGKRLSEGDCTALRRDIGAYVEANFRPIRSFVARKQPVSGFEGSFDLHSFFYSQVNPMQLQSAATEDGVTFEEEGLEFRFGRYLVDRKRVIMDDFSCNITISDHTLMRLIQRKACAREPIAFLNGQMSSILPYVPIYLGAAVLTNSSVGMMLPMPDGLLMGVFTISRQPEAVGMHFRRRIGSWSTGSGLVPSPVPNAFPAEGDVETMVSMRISTYISLPMMSPDQLWCRAALMALSRDNQPLHDDLLATLIAPEVMHSQEVGRRMVPAYRDFRRITDSDFWRRANKLDLNT